MACKRSSVRLRYSPPTKFGLKNAVFGAFFMDFIVILLLYQHDFSMAIFFKTVLFILY